MKGPENVSAGIEAGEAHENSEKVLFEFAAGEQPAALLERIKKCFPESNVRPLTVEAADPNSVGFCIIPADDDQSSNEAERLLTKFLEKVRGAAQNGTASVRITVEYAGDDILERDPDGNPEEDEGDSEEEE